LTECTQTATLDLQQRLDDRTHSASASEDMLDNLSAELNAARVRHFPREHRYLLIHSQSFIEAAAMSTSDAAATRELAKLRQTNEELTGRVLRRTEQIGRLQAELKRLETNLALATPPDSADSGSDDITGVLHPANDDDRQAQLTESIARQSELQSTVLELEVTLQATIFVALETRAALRVALADLEDQRADSDRHRDELHTELANCREALEQASHAHDSEKALSHEALATAASRLEAAISVHLALEADLAASHEINAAEQATRIRVEGELADLSQRHASTLDHIAQAKNEVDTSRAAAEGAELRIHELCDELGERRAEAEVIIIDLGHQLDALRLQVEERDRALHEADSRLRSPQALAPTAEVADQLHEELARQGEAFAKMRESFEAADCDNAMLRNDARESMDRLNTATADLEATRGQLIEVTGLLSTTTTRRDHLESRVVALEEMLGEAERVRADARGEAEDTRTRLTGEIATLRKLCAQKDETTQRLQMDLAETREEATGAWLVRFVASGLTCA
jgi:hypothetical protein